MPVFAYRRALTLDIFEDTHFTTHFSHSNNVHLCGEVGKRVAATLLSFRLLRVSFPFNRWGGESQLQQVPASFLREISSSLPFEPLGSTPCTIIHQTQEDPSLSILETL